MLNKPVLVRKQVSAPAQQFQQVGGGSPKLSDLIRVVGGGKNVGVMPRMAALAGIAGKGAAGLATTLQTAHQLQGGNLFAPLNLQYTYEGYDPSRAISSAVNPTVQQQRAERQERQNKPNRIAFSAGAPQGRIYGPLQQSSSPAAQPQTQSTAPMRPNTTPQAPPTGLTPAMAAGAFTGGQNPTGGVVPTQALPTGVSDSQIIDTGFAANTAMHSSTDPINNLSQMYPPVSSDPYASYQQQQLQFRPSGPQGALPPDPNSPAQQRGPPTHQQSQFNPQQPLDPSMFSTNPSDAQAYAAYQRLQNPNQLQTSNDFVHDLFDTMGTYLYKMTPEEAGAFAVDAYFKMRE
jgi:hypothetical protein